VSERATIRDVAARASVSVATVSRVMNEKDDVSAATRERVRAAATALGYAPARAARALPSGRTGVVGIVLGDSSGHRDLSVMFFGKVIAAISRRLAEAERDPLLLNVFGSEHHRSAAHRFDAAILIGLEDDDALVRELLAAQVPCVGIDIKCEGSRFAYVGSDHAEGVRLSVRHLYALGHRRIAHIAGALNAVAGIDRLQAFRDETSTLALDAPVDYIRHGDFSSGSGYREACALLALPSPPTALLVASDHMALAALQAVWDFGLEPGRDVGVVGFDDLEVAALSHPPLTTIRQDREALGTLAAVRAIDLIDDPDARPPTTLLPVELVVRASSAAMRPRVA